MDNKYSIENKENYSKNESLLPNNEVNNVIKKILLLEELFKYKEVDSIRPYFALSFDSYNSVCIEQNIEILWEDDCQISNNLFNNAEVILSEIKEMDKAFADYLIINDYYNYEDDVYLRNKMEKEVQEIMNNFLVNTTVERKNRYDFYASNDSFLNFFNNGNKEYFKQYVESLKNNEIYNSPYMELYGNEFSIIPTDFKNYQIPSFQRMLYYKNNFYFEEIKDFIIESFSNLQDSNGVLNITIDNKNQRLSSVLINKEKNQPLLNYETKLLSFNSSVKTFQIKLKDLKESLKKTLTDIVEFTKIKNHDTNVFKIANEIEILINKKVLNSILSENSEINNKIHKNRL